MLIKVEFIAEVVHNLLRSWVFENQGVLWDYWDFADRDSRVTTIIGVEKVVQAFHDGGALSPSVVWENWATAKKDLGWTYGPVKDSAKKEHPCLVPDWNMLPPEEQVKDLLFIGAVHLVLKAYGFLEHEAKHRSTQVN